MPVSLIRSASATNFALRSSLAFKATCSTALSTATLTPLAVPPRIAPIRPLYPASFKFCCQFSPHFSASLAVLAPGFFAHKSVACSGNSCNASVTPSSRPRLVTSHILAFRPLPAGIFLSSLPSGSSSSTACGIAFIKPASAALVALTPSFRSRRYCSPLMFAPL